MKLGYSHFKLDILEYCDPIRLIQREQYYIDKLNPEYNILNIAGSSVGFKHSITTKDILREKSRGRIYSEDTLNKISVNNSMSKSVSIKDIYSGVVVEFTSISKASEFIGILPYHFQHYLDRQPIKGKYLIIKLDDESIITRSPAKSVKTGSSSKNILFTVTLDETSTVTEFTSYTKAAAFVGTERTYLSRTIAKKGFYTGYGYTVKKKD